MDKDLELLNNITRANGTEEGIDKAVKTLMTYNPWTLEQVESGEQVRDALANAYKTILKNVKSSPARTRALNMLTDARMLANQAISFDGLV